jgi:hypothetical protein
MISDLHALRYRTRYPGTIDRRLKSSGALMVSGCKLWLAADQITGKNDADALSTWGDLSGNGNNVVQATEANRPLYKTNIQNSLPAVRFDGSNDRMTVTFTLTQPCSYYVVFVKKATSTDRRIIDGVAGRCGLNIKQTTQYLVADATTGLPNATGMVNGTTYIARGIFNGASSSVALNNAAYTTGNAGVTNPGGITLAAFIDGTFNGQVDICEVCVYQGAVSSADETALLGYLNVKWAVY